MGERIYGYHAIEEGLKKAAAGSTLCSVAVDETTLLDCVNGSEGIYEGMNYLRSYSVGYDGGIRNEVNWFNKKAKILFVAYETFSSLPMELSVCCDGTSGSLRWNSYFLYRHISCFLY